MNIGESIRMLRKAAGMSQQELADKVGLSRPAISQIEGGKNHPTERTLDAICETLYITPGVLYIFSLRREDMPARNRKTFDLLFPTIKAMLMQLIA